MRKFVLPLALLLSVGAAAQKNTDAAKFAGGITAKDLKAKLSVIAGAGMEGRETATPGQKRAAAYIENFFKSIGLQPGNGSDYQQKYPVYQDSLTSATLSINGTALAIDKDFNV